MSELVRQTAAARPARDIVVQLKRDGLDRQRSLHLVAETTRGERVTLRPLPSSAQGISQADVQRLTTWRNQNRQFFLTDFEATRERTRRWLDEQAGPDPTRVLFMLDAADGTTFGHVGLCEIEARPGYCELDNIVRGEGGPKGAMLAATETLCGWATETLGLHDVWVRVMADNPAVGFYQKLGFSTVKDVLLRQSREGDGFVRWLEVGAAGSEPAIPEARLRYLRYMRRAPFA